MGDTGRVAHHHQPVRAGVRGGLPGRSACGTRDISRCRRPAITLAGFMAVFAAVFLAGYYDLQDRAALTFWAEGQRLVDGALRVPDLRRRTHRPARPPAVPGGWIVVHRGAARELRLRRDAAGAPGGRGINLDKLVVGPLTAGQGGVGGINVYGQVRGSQNIYRVNALTGDPNHLGVMLCVPLLVFLPVLPAATAEAAGGWAGCCFSCSVVQVLTLSRSGRTGRHRRPARAVPGTARGHLPRARTIGIVLERRWRRPSPRCIRRQHFVRAGRSSLAHSAKRRQHPDPPPVLPARTTCPRPASAVRDGLQHLRRLLPVRDGPQRLRPARRPGSRSWSRPGLVGMALYLAYFVYLVACAAAIRRATDPDISAAGWGPAGGAVATGRPATCST